MSRRTYRRFRAAVLVSLSFTGLSAGATVGYGEPSRVNHSQGPMIARVPMRRAPTAASVPQLDCVTLMGGMGSGTPRTNQDAFAMLFGHLHGLSPSLVAQQLNTPEQNLVLAMPTNMLPPLKQFPDVLEPLVVGPAHGGPAAVPSLPEAAAKVRDSLRARRIYGSLVRASTMDGWFSPFEGNKAPEFSRLDAKLPMEDQLADMAAAQKAGSRTTPFETHTDDTQFWMAGVMTTAGLSEHDNVDGLLATWRQLGQQQVWRNGGSRTAKFLAGKDDAFRGEVGAGDFLRGLSVFLLDPPRWRANWTQAAAKMNLTGAQTHAVSLFLSSYEAHLDGKPESAPLSKLTAEGVLPPRLQAMFKALDKNVVRDGDWFSYVRSFENLGTDHDTYAFLGGLFAEEKTLSLASTGNGPTHVRTYAAAAAFRTAGVSVTVPDDFRWKTIRLERARNDELSQLRLGAQQLAP